MVSLKALDGKDASPLCFGCMQFGGTAAAAASRAMFEACRDAGINLFDTAHTYTGGRSEELLGDFIKQDRDALIIATKTGYTGGSGRENILAQFDESRSRLKLDAVDILYLHRWDPTPPLLETFETLCELQSQGKVRHIGVSNFAAWQVMKSQAVAEQFGTRIDVLQPMYSLIKRQAEVELFPMALSEGFAVAAYSPLGSGLLTGKYQAGGKGRLSTDKRYAARYGQPWMVETAQTLSALAREWGTDPATLAVAWAAKHPAVSAPIISGRNAEQLDSSLKALGVSLAAEQYTQIEALSQRPAPATDRLEEAPS
ncbi:aldo/keto reductase [uncultured Tateyamaria sp.]|uniref:aldo/keto reductase n=1 Tax=uncultured Tateyamaria sp. TaxID=455651 RepID=UPI0026033BF7|nr:aldo/keto reductase [uncultured Tateyamaria sp.]